MAHAIGCIGTSTDLRTKTRMTREQRERNTRLVPRKVRNQTRAIAFVEIMRPGEMKPKVKAIRDGHLTHYRNAYFWAEVRYLEKDGKKLVVKRS